MEPILTRMPRAEAVFMAVSACNFGAYTGVFGIVFVVVVVVVVSTLIRWVVRRRGDEGGGGRDGRRRRGMRRISGGAGKLGRRARSQVGEKEMEWWRGGAEGVEEDEEEKEGVFTFLDGLGMNGHSLEFGDDVRRTCRAGGGFRRRLPSWGVVGATLLFSSLGMMCYYYSTPPLLAILRMITTTTTTTPSEMSSPADSSPDHHHHHHQAANTLQNVFQIYRAPPTLPAGTPHCTMQLMDHVFAFSYGKPFVGSYTPPTTSNKSSSSACPHFNSVTLTMTVTSQGRQFDRLALLYLGDIEIFRTSTAEPTAEGIVWSYTKDVSAYLALWRERQTLIFDLGNLVDERYTGTFNVSLRADFAEVEGQGQGAQRVLPISGRRGGRSEPSAFSVPREEAVVKYVVPAGVERAIVTIAACGQGEEEFWYSNVLERERETFADTVGSLYGFSPFREVQLLIDGFLAGVVWPFPIIFTGGIAPGFWRPVVGIDAFDLREPEVDITPWIPWLSDGKEHHFQIRVVGLEGEGENVGLSREVGDYWVVTGKIFLFLGDRQRNIRDVERHDLPSIFAPDPEITASSIIEKSANGTNETLSYSVAATRSLVITSAAGSWVQNLEFQNHNLLTSQGLTQSTVQDTRSSFVAINFRDPRLSFSVASSYPLSVNTTIGIFANSSGISIDASLSRGLEIESTGRVDESLFTLTSGESKLDTSQFGTAHYSSQRNRSYSFGDTTQDFWESSRQGISVVHVEAVNGSIASTDENDGQDSFGSGTFGALPHLSETALPGRSLRGMVGRGPDSISKPHG
jgi:Peptide N-acetyl-beta-D-glucosaminyl asparaginase amidase A